MDSSIENSQKFKMIFLGDQGTGKSCILNRYVNDTFDENYQATIGLDFQNKNITIGNTDCRLLLYDTAGQEKFRSLIPLYIRDAQIILLVYDITRPDSFESISKWFSDILEIKTTSAIYVLVGNKIDLSEERKISYEQGQKLAEEKNMLFEEVSAKTGNGFDKLFENKVYNAIYNKYKNLLSSSESENNIDLQEKNKGAIRIDEQTPRQDEQIKKKKKCC